MSNYWFKVSKEKFTLWKMWAISHSVTKWAKYIIEHMGGLQPCMDEQLLVYRCKVSPHELTFVFTMWLTQANTIQRRTFSPQDPRPCVTFTCLSAVIVCFLRQDPLCNLQVPLRSWPHQPIPCFARWRQRRLLSVVACWDRCVTDAMWVTAVRVKNCGALI